MSQCYVTTMYRLDSWGSPQLPFEINESNEAKNFKKDHDQCTSTTTTCNSKGHNGHLIYEANVRINTNNHSVKSQC